MYYVGRRYESLIVIILYLRGSLIFDQYTIRLLHDSAGYVSLEEVDQLQFFTFTTQLDALYKCYSSLMCLYHTGRLNGLYSAVICKNTKKLEM